MPVTGRHPTDVTETHKELEDSRGDTGRGVPRLVAHRGYPAHYPENTLAGIEAALREGARFVEVDVQFSADGVPVLMHNADLRRTTGHPGRVMDLPLAELERLRAGEPERFGNRYADAPIPTLLDLVQLLHHWPEATAFVEIKQDSLDHFGIAPVVETVLRKLEPLQPRCVPISFSEPALRHVRRVGVQHIGWAFRAWGDAALATARDLAPDYLFCDHRRVPQPPEPLWRGPWQWVLYDITDPAQALAFNACGADLIETRAIGDMLAHLSPSHPPRPAL